MRLLLASKSATRRAMLENAGIPFESVEAELDEKAAKEGLLAAGFEAADLAEELAQLKALAARSAPGDLVIGSDQVLETADGTLLSKPQSREEAFTQLAALRGSTHRLHSAAVVTEQGEPVWSAVESVAMTMRPFGDAFLETYLDLEYERIRWSVGGYQIEGRGAQLFERIDGSHFAILGMPLLPLMDFLRRRGLLAS